MIVHEPSDNDLFKPIAYVKQYFRKKRKTPEDLSMQHAFSCKFIKPSKQEFNVLMNPPKK